MVGFDPPASRPARREWWRQIQRQHEVTTAPTGAGPIAGVLAAPELLAHVLVSKFIEHMPLYRQQDERARAGILILRSTFCGWLEQCAQLLKPLVELMHKEVLRSGVMFVSC